MHLGISPFKIVNVCAVAKVIRESLNRYIPFKKLKLAACSLLPSLLYLDHSHYLVLAPATLAALPSTRAISQTRVFYVADPVSSIRPPRRVN